jgi:hypothetical protein
VFLITVHVFVDAPPSCTQYSGVADDVAVAFHERVLWHFTRDRLQSIDNTMHGSLDNETTLPSFVAIVSDSSRILPPQVRRRHKRSFCLWRKLIDFCCESCDHYSQTSLSRSVAFLQQMNAYIGVGEQLSANLSALLSQSVRANAVLYTVQPLMQEMYTDLCNIEESGKVSEILCDRCNDEFDVVIVANLNAHDMKGGLFLVLI